METQRGHLENPNRQNKDGLGRKAAEITLARINDYAELNADTEAEGGQKFLELSRKLWKEFAVSGITKIDEDTGEARILTATDLDGKGAIGFLKLAGFKMGGLKFVAAGEYLEGHVNLDTGNRDGFVIEDEGKTAFADHHGPNSGNDTSATQITYDMLTESGFLKRTPELDRLAQFVTQMDNKTFPDYEKYFPISDRTILGLYRFINFDNLVKFIKSGKAFTDQLTDAELKSYNLLNRKDEQRAVIRQSEQGIKELYKEGYVVHSDKYGFIIIDPAKKVPGGFDAARAFKAGAYIIWSEANQSFFLSTAKPLQETFSQGKKIRETMWIKPRHDREPLRITLGEILDKMTDGKLQPTNNLKAYLDQERAALAA